jgi:hypothetical protein
LRGKDPLAQNELVTTPIAIGLVDRVVAVAQLVEIRVVAVEAVEGIIAETALDGIGPVGEPIDGVRPWNNSTRPSRSCNAGLKKKNRPDPSYKYLGLSSEFPKG